MTAFGILIQALRQPVRPLAAPWRPMRQRQLADWAAAVFPGRRRKTEERAARLVQEALALGHAAGLSQEKLQALAASSASGPAPDLEAAAGALGVALLNFCETAGIDADQAECRHINWLLSTPYALFNSRARAPRSGPKMPPVASEKAVDGRQEPVWTDH